jgi:broad specificity phosphatase PhoE
MAAFGMRLELEQANYVGGGKRRHCPSLSARWRLSFATENSTLRFRMVLSRSSFADVDCGGQNVESSMIIHGLRLATIALTAGLALSTTASSARSQTEWINTLRQGGHVIVFRHGATHQDQADTDPLNLKNVAQQRQLNDQGRALARSIGDSLRKLRIPVAQVHTSMFNRAVETGSLIGLGTLTASVDITEGGLVVTPIENNRRTQALRTLAATPPPAGSNVVIVTHKPNIMDAFGKDWFDVREGEASVFKPEGGGYKLIVRVRAEEWGRLAQTAAN